MNSRAEGIHEDLEWNQSDHEFTKQYYDHVDLHRYGRRNPSCPWCYPPKRPTTTNDIRARIQTNLEAQPTGDNVRDGM